MNRKDIENIVGHADLLEDDIDILLKYSNSVDLCIDLGTFAGASAYIMSSVAKHVVTIDMFESILDTDIHQYVKLFNDNPHYYTDVVIKLYSLTNNITVLKGITHDFGRYFRSVGVLFIDADHSYNGCKLDFDSWTDSVISGGHVIFHDYEKDSFGVGKFTNELFNNGTYEMVDKSTASIVFRKN